MLRRVWLILFVLLLGKASAQSDRLPKFSDHPVSKIYRGKVHAPKFGDLSQYQGTEVRCFGEDSIAYAHDRVKLRWAFCY